MKTSQYSLQGIKFPLTELMLLMVAVVWGTSYGLTKEALAYTSVFAFIALRFGMTFVLLLPHLVSAFRKGHNRDWTNVLPTGCILLCIFLCEVAGIAYTSATNAAILISLSMIMTAFVESLVSRTWVSRSLVVASVVSVIGVGLLASGNSDAFSRHDFSLNKGDYLILMAAFLRAVMVTTTKYMTEGKRITALSMTGIQSAIVSIGAFILALLFVDNPSSTTALQDTSFLSSSSYFWAVTLYLVLFATLFAFFAQNYAVRVTSSTKVALLMGSEPLFGALFANLWLGEALSGLQLFGSAMIVASVLYVSLRSD